MGCGVRTPDACMWWHLTRRRGGVRFAKIGGPRWLDGDVDGT